MIHNKPSELAGQTVTIVDNATHPQFEIAGVEYRVEDWWDRVYGKGWGESEGNPAALIYAMRSAFQPTPLSFDNEVLYGKIGGLGVLVHISEIVKEQPND